ncbi:hypothetical protein NDU88_004375 [Pleurodeles waltl]|uniref:Uncharacterized protein n=1 Tax=Pleurodeles waltl TaxID=8319 RepID=A0AAV7T871_PLEWA|nr:hypothetical protein NDU88_004375 [Pleurodeles waltl]
MLPKWYCISKPASPATCHHIPYKLSSIITEGDSGFPETQYLLHRSFGGHPAAHRVISQLRKTFSTKTSRVSRCTQPGSASQTGRHPACPSLYTTRERGPHRPPPSVSLAAHNQGAQATPAATQRVPLCTQPGSAGHAGRHPACLSLHTTRERRPRRPPPSVSPSVSLAAHNQGTRATAAATQRVTQRVSRCTQPGNAGHPGRHPACPSLHTTRERGPRRPPPSVSLAAHNQGARATPAATQRVSRWSAGHAGRHPACPSLYTTRERRPCRPPPSVSLAAQDQGAWATPAATQRVPRCTQPGNAGHAGRHPACHPACLSLHTTRERGPRRPPPSVSPSVSLAAHNQGTRATPAATQRVTQRVSRCTHPGNVGHAGRHPACHPACPSLYTTRERGPHRPPPSVSLAAHNQGAQATPAATQRVPLCTQPGSAGHACRHPACLSLHTTRERRPRRSPPSVSPSVSLAAHNQGTRATPAATQRVPRCTQPGSAGHAGRHPACPSLHTTRERGPRRRPPSVSLAGAWATPAANQRVPRCTQPGSAGHAGRHPACLSLHKTRERGTRRPPPSVSLAAHNQGTRATPAATQRVTQRVSRCTQPGNAGHAGRHPACHPACLSLHTTRERGPPRPPPSVSPSVSLAAHNQGTWATPAATQRVTQRVSRCTQPGNAGHPGRHPACLSLHTTRERGPRRPPPSVSLTAQNQGARATPAATQRVPRCTQPGSAGHAGRHPACPSLHTTRERGPRRPPPSVSPSVSLAAHNQGTRATPAATQRVSRCTQPGNAGHPGRHPACHAACLSLHTTRERGPRRLQSLQPASSRAALSDAPSLFSALLLVTRLVLYK